MEGISSLFLKESDQTTLGLGLEEELDTTRKKPLNPKVSKDKNPRLNPHLDWSMSTHAKRRRKEQRKADLRRLREQIASVQLVLDELPKRRSFYTPLLSGDELAVGSIGYICFAVQGTVSYQARVQQILDEHNMLVRIGGTLLWLRGCSTTGLVTDATISLRRVMRVTGTTTYDTITGGTHTAFVIEPVDTAPHMEAILRIIQSYRPRE